MPKDSPIESISAVTLFCHDMAAGVRFYRALGFELAYGGEAADFTVFRAGGGFLNLVSAAPEATWSPWGRIVIYVDDVDAQYRRAIEAGLAPEFEPRDAPWHERYFHILDPAGHELSFARRIRSAES